MRFTPEIDQALILETASGRVGGVVTAVEPVVRVEVDGEPGDVLDQPLLASFPDPLGLVRAPVLARLVSSSPTVLELEVGEAERFQRRTSARARTEARVVLTAVSGDFEHVVVSRGVSVDLSRGGVRVSVDDVFPAGTRVMVAIDLNGEVVQAVGEVLESTESREMRVVFLAMTEDAGEHITSRVMSATLSTPGARRLRRR